MPAPELKLNTGVEAILDLTGTNREAKAYAFLYAAFKRTEISSNPVRDALDCLTPFIAPYLNTIVGKQVSVEGIKHNLKASFGFDIPLYAIEQLMSALQKAGYVEFNRNIHAFIAKQQQSHFDVLKSEIETAFDEVVAKLSAYAKEKGYPIDPPDGWGEVLITFLKTRTDRANAKVVNVKGVLLSPSKVENAIVGAFVKNLYDLNQAFFAKLLNIFMGVLIEEFISSVSEIGGADLNQPVHVFYDTAVLLRLLGCSGKLLKNATEELTRYLQDLGFQIYYFSGNEAEVSGILDTLIHKRDTGRELEGETADAISNGDITMTQIRMLQNTFAERLATLNVFSAQNFEKSAIENARHQINERGFSEYLKRHALVNQRVYGLQNRENDAGYLGSIVRLRAGLSTKDLSGCGYIFVTSNKFLARASRRYLIENRVMQPQHCPPMLSVGQIATIAWLMKDQILEPEKAGRELLSNCFAAYRPDQEWFQHFREGVEEVKGNIDEYGGDPKNALTLQAARRIAQEESFGESALVRQLNMVEIFSRAEQENKRILEEKDSQAEAERAAAALKLDSFAREAEQARLRAAEKAAIESKEAVRIAVLEAENKAEARHVEERSASAHAKADKVVFALKIIAVILFAAVCCVAICLQWRGQPSTALWIILAVLAIVNILTFMDFLGLRVAEHSFALLRDWIADMFTV